jgi:hypothetical protein
VKSSHYSLLRIIRERSAYPAGLLLIQMHHQRSGCCGMNLSVRVGATIVRTSCNQSESLNRNLVLRRESGPECAGRPVKVIIGEAQFLSPSNLWRAQPQISFNGSWLPLLCSRAWLPLASQLSTHRLDQPNPVATRP